MKPFDVEIYWGRLCAAVDEAANGLMRTAFAGIVRDCRDFACGLFDRRGVLLAQDTYGTPGLAGTLPGTLQFLLENVSADGLEDGDVLITNDPWGATGHLLDTTVLTPIFAGGELSGYALSCAHKIDIGGRGMTIESRDVHEEGLWLPVLKLMRKGEPNADLWELIRSNVRAKTMVLGDIHAQLSANEICALHYRRVLESLGVQGVCELADTISARTEERARSAISTIRNGSYTATLSADPRRGRHGSLEPVLLAVTVKVGDNDVEVDYSGTTDQAADAVNCPFNGLTLSYTLMALKSILDPHVPINDGYLRAITVSAPKGSILNPRYPASTRSRSQIGHLIPDLIFKALSKAIPEGVLAESGTVPAWNQQIDGIWADGTPFAQFIPIRGGLAARPDRDGLACVSFPTNVSTIPTEVLEAESPVVVVKKEILTDSAGAGKFRGGCGQEVILSVPSDADVIADRIFLGMTGGRFDLEIDGLCGGLPAPKGGATFNGSTIRTGALRPLAPGDVVGYRTPGGGGFWPPYERDPVTVAEDVRDGYVSREAATSAYGVALDRNGGVDKGKTAELRTIKNRQPVF